MPKTPLGQIVSIRSEEDKDMLKNFTKEQNDIRNEWRSKHSGIEDMTEEEKAAKVREVQNILAKAFG